MKPVFKITLISFLAVVVTLIIAISVMLWIVFTPAKLTPIVNSQLKNYLNCDAIIGDVELTFFSTFPEFSLKTNSLNLIQPLDEAPTDTLLKTGKIIAVIDIKNLWKENKLMIHKLIFEDIQFNGFVNKVGNSNFDILKTDTTNTDTAAFVNPFDLIKLDKMQFKNMDIHYADLKSGMHAHVLKSKGDLSLKMLKNEIVSTVNIKSHDITFHMDSIDYLKNADIQLEMPFDFNTATQKMNVAETRLIINELALSLKGNMALNPNNADINIDFIFKSEKYPLPKLLSLIPKLYLTSLEGTKLDGIVSSKGTVKGLYNEKSMPLIVMNVGLEDGKFEYAGLENKFSQMSGDAKIIVNLNNELASNIFVNQLIAQTGKSKFEAKGLIDYILADDMLFDMDMKIHAFLDEFVSMVPKEMDVKMSGLAEGTAKMKFMLSEMMDFKFEKIKLDANLNATQLGISYDTLSMYTDNANIKLKMPNSHKSSTQFMSADLRSKRLEVCQGKNTRANFNNINLRSETSDFFKTDKLNNYLFDFDFELLTASMDNMHMQATKSKANVQMKMNFSDTISLPAVTSIFDIKALHLQMDTIQADIQSPNGSFALRSDIQNPTKTIFDINYVSTSTKGNMGSQHIVANSMSVLANILHNPDEKNSMLQWIPKGHVAVNDARIKMDGVNVDIQIPLLDFDFSQDVYSIRKAKVLVDNSDFNLTGKLWNVNEYFRNKGLLMGNFTFKSNTTDVHRLMELTNGFGEQDSTLKIEEANANYKTEQSIEKSSGPYMVPKGMDLKLSASINEVLLGYDSAQDLLGNVYVKDGLLVLEDLRFKTSAANMQLTAMYRTPRPNHIFIGLDYHILDMEISELLKMIPDVDSIMPMLRSFGGKGEFHIAVETYVDSLYNLKKSTLRGVSSIKGENLVLMDGETFSEIAKTLRFNKKTVNKVDSLSAEFTIFRNEVDVYPFLIVMDKYKAVVSGRHNLDMTFDYNISVTDSPLPFKLGIDVKGTLDKMKYSLVKPRYANLYRPSARREIDNKQLEIRKMIRDAIMSRVIQE